MVWLSVVAGVFVVASATTASITACGDSAQCNRVRNDTAAKLKTWAACSQFDDVCRKIPGNFRDCSGVLSCDFAVNDRHSAEAQDAVLRIANETQGCYLCAQPNCPNGDFAVCDLVAQQCIIATTISGGGSTSFFDVFTPPAAEAGVDGD
jgi:hypothetical protein